jgi:hypothetical protein
VKWAVREYIVLKMGLHTHSERECDFESLIVAIRVTHVPVDLTEGQPSICQRGNLPKNLTLGKTLCPPL